ASPQGQDQADVVLVPLTTGGLRLFGQRFLRTITVAVDDVERIDDTQSAVTALLQSRHQTADFQIRNMASILDTATETQDTLTILLGSIAAISLVVGGIGVMNIMLVSVTERTFEVGLRKAVGATRRQILLQFLIESGLLCALGGVLGLLLAWGVTVLITALASITMTITLGYILLALIVSTVIGM
ncbi:macrolide ABC transporter permease/ATP-binding protein MacB, partial [Lacticaseibacillus rhamnosus]